MLVVVYQIGESKGTVGGVVRYNVPGESGSLREREGGRKRRWKSRGAWCSLLPEGRIPGREGKSGKTGETPERCLVREMMEEFGVEVEVHDFFCSTIYHYQHGAIELLAYRTAYRTGEFRLNVHSAMRWAPPEALHDYDFAEADIPIAQKLSAQGAP